MPPTIAEKCSFSDATTISFGHDAAGTNSGAQVWKAGDYEATAFRASARVIIPPMENRIEISPGLYTIFVYSSKGEPWTLIVSKKAPKAGMAYPGERFDVGRTPMGFDDSRRQPAKGVKIGCANWGHDQKNPMFVYIESGTHVAYAKIQTIIRYCGPLQITKDRASVQPTSLAELPWKSGHLWPRSVEI